MSAHAVTLNTGTLPGSRDGSMQVISSEWDGNGSARVTVRCSSYPRTERVDRKARDLARRTLTHARWARLDAVQYVPGEGLRYRFTVSRLGREYR